MMLTLRTLRQNFQQTAVFLSFPETGFGVSCKLSLMETICMKCQLLFSGENKKNITNLSPVELVHSYKC